MSNISSRVIFITLSLMFMSISQADEVDPSNPMSIIRSSTSAMINELVHRRDEIKTDQTIVMNIVEELLIPHFASNTISRKVLGIHAKKVSAEQKAKFSAAFKIFMIRFYADVFAQYSNQTFKYLPAPKFEKKKRVTIKTQLIQSGGSPVAIDYRMQRSGKTWKIVDLKVEGISMVISNKKQFTSQISKDGIDTVIAKLEYKNKKAMTQHHAK